MKRIGFIDYYLDEWHANNYPEMIKNITNNEMVVSYAYGKIDAPSGRTNASWCEEMSITQCKTIDEVVDKSDYIVVLSPDNPEMHEELCQIPLRSGKPTYVDKTFTPTKESAIRLFNLAKEYSTPIFSSSALRFSKEFMAINKAEVDFVASVGPGEIENYIVHQVEPMVALMDSRATSLMYTGTDQTACFLINFESGKQGVISMLGDDCAFSSFISYKDKKTVVIQEATDFFKGLVINIVDFFEKEKPNAPKEQTVEIMAIIENAILSQKTPNVWIDMK